jgi:hypothetical protein
MLLDISSSEAAMAARRYLAILFLVALLATPALLIARVAPLGCPVAAEPGRFLAFCRNGAYQDFEHGAYALGLRPAAVAAARRAPVLFLGNSRLELDFSTAATTRAFADAGLGYYLLGFGYGETDGFAGALLHDLALHPRAVVIDVDPFFDGRLGEPAQFLRDHPIRAALDYRAKAAAAAMLAALCPAGAAGWPCSADALALMRDDTTGAWTISGPGLDTATPFDSRNGKASDPESFIVEARRFLAGLDLPPRCVVLTTVPTPQRPLDAATVRHIADALGARWAEPQLDGLTSFDRSHLTQESAERWSAAFLAEIMPILKGCAG